MPRGLMRILQLRFPLPEQDRWIEPDLEMVHRSRAAN